MIAPNVSPRALSGTTIPDEIPSSLISRRCSSLCAPWTSSSSGHLADQEGLARLQHLRDSLGLIEVGRVAAVEVPRELLPLGNAVPYGNQPNRAVGTGDVNRAPVGEPGYHQPHEVPHDDVEVERPVEDSHRFGDERGAPFVALLPGYVADDRRGPRQ